MKLIMTNKEYDQTLDRLNVLFDANPKSKEGQEADVLALLIEEYVDKHYSIEAPDPITMIRIRMEELEIKQKDLVGIIGSKGPISEVLNRKRKLTVGMRRNLSAMLKITTQILIHEYELKP
jgi:HTH-type transcriptional regulator/antitoxin HigA